MLFLIFIFSPGCPGARGVTIQYQHQEILAKIVITPSDSSVSPNKSIKLKATGYTFDDKEMACKPEWYMDKEGSSAGILNTFTGNDVIFTAKKTGIATLTARSDNIKGSAKISVQFQPQKALPKMVKAPPKVIPGPVKEEVPPEEEDEESEPIPIGKYRIYFKHDSSSLTRSQLRKVKNISVEDGDIIIISGHTNSIGSKKYNKMLSYRRALAVKRIFHNKYPDLKYKIKAYGESHPKYSNMWNKGLRLNRNCTITVRHSDE
jgi:outer membrane protein OmpA-like peptidoglycan-associated protein